VGDHTNVSYVHLFRVAAVSAVVMLAIACGPTASAVKPTLPPRTLAPRTSPRPLDSSPLGTASTASGSPAAVQSGSPAASTTPQPPGIAQPITGFSQGSAYEVSGVTTTPTGFLAVGFAGTDQGYFGLHQGIVWTSPDGLTWQQSVDPAFVDVTPSYVVSLGNDVYLFGNYSACAQAIDQACSDDPNAGLVIFKSAGGGPWAQLAQPQDILQAQFDGVTTWNNKLVAWGAAADDNGTATVWTSSDGLTWAPSADLANIDPVDSVGAGGPGLVAFGAAYVESIQDVKLVGATSTDGAHFASGTVPEITGASIVQAAAGPGGMAGVGWAASDTTPSLGLAIYSADGVTWTQATASDASFDDTLIDDLHSSSTEYVAIGSTVDPNDMSLQTGRVWVSANGQSWRSSGAFGGTFSQYGDSALGPNGLVVFTADQQDAGGDNNVDVNSTIYGWFIPNDKLAP